MNRGGGAMGRRGNKAFLLKQPEEYRIVPNRYEIGPGYTASEG